MKAQGNLTVSGQSSQTLGLIPLTSFPTSATKDAIFNVNGVLYKCAAVSPLTFVQLDQRPFVYKHTQISASKTWTINHNLNTRTPIVVCFNSAYSVLAMSSCTSSTLNQTTVTFSSNPSGYAMVFSVE